MRSSWRGAGVAAAVVLTRLAVNGCFGDGTFSSRRDAATFVAVGRHPFSDAHDWPLVPVVWGTAYRYGRIGYPALGWLLAAGRSALVPAALALVMAASVGAAVWCACELARDANRDPRLGIAIVALPFTLIWFVHPALASDPFALATVLGAYLANQRGRAGLAMCLAATAVLGREVALVALVPLAVTMLRRHGRRALAPLGLVLVPAAAWWTWVRVRIGWFPWDDPSFSRRFAIGGFLDGPRKLFESTDPHLAERIALGCGAATFIFAVAIALLHVRDRRLPSPLTCAALLLACTVAWYGPLVWGVADEAHRVLAFAQALLVVALVTEPHACTRRPSSCVRPGTAAARRTP